MHGMAERLTFLEGQAREHAIMIDASREALAGLETELRFLRGEMTQRFAAVDQRLDGLDAKMSRQFGWLVGVQVMTLAAVVTALGTILATVSR